MSRNQARLLRFFIAYPGWQSIGRESRRSCARLAESGFIEGDESRPRRYRLALREEIRAILERESS